MLLACQHMFCKVCLVKANENGHNQCPLCRALFTISGSEVARSAKRRVERLSDSCKRCLHRMSHSEFNSHAPQCKRGTIHFAV